MFGGIVGMDIKTFRRTTPSSVGRPVLTYQLTMALYVETSWCPYQQFHRTYTIDLTASIVSCQSCVVYTTFVGNSVLSFTTSELNCFMIHQNSTVTHFFSFFFCQRNWRNVAPASSFFKFTPPLHSFHYEWAKKLHNLSNIRPLLLFSLFLFARARSFFQKYKKKTFFEIDQAAARPRPVTLTSSCKLHDTTIENHKADENQGRVTFRWWHEQRK